MDGPLLITTGRKQRKAVNDEAAAVKFVADLQRDVRMGKQISPTERLAAFRKFTESGRLCTLECMLPLVLNLKGKPYTLEKHFPFSPLFNTQLSRNFAIKAARQVSKSTSLASSGILFANSVPHVSLLFITPLFEQIRRFSGMYVRGFIDQSPVKSLWSDTSTENSVLQRTFKNFSKMIFSFALLDADRTRGISADVNSFDEVQDLDRDHVPIIQETMSASEWGISRFTGTPKSLDNTLEGYWLRSSMAEWVVPCFSCGHDNVPRAGYDLLDMIGPWRDDISNDSPGVICAKCKRPVHPRFGHWWHEHPGRRLDFSGYHVPQIIMPEHYSKPEKWSVLLSKQQYMPQNVFFNEVLGESFDTGSKIVTLTELNAASVLPWKNTWKDPDGTPDAGTRRMLSCIDSYPLKVLGVDWGGGGKEGVSFTTLALLGWRSDGKMDVLWGKRLLTPHDHLREAEEIRKWILKLKPHLVAHDYTGAGTLRETFLVQSGVPLARIVPIAYVRSASAAPMNAVKATPIHPRDHYLADKTRTLLLTTNCLKLGHLRFFQPDYVNDDNPGLLRDFLALIDEKVESHSSGGLYVIKRQEGFSDDFAHAVNLACVTSWHTNQAWPNVAEMAGVAAFTPEMMTAAAGVRELGWGDDEMESFFSGGWNQ